MHRLALPLLSLLLGASIHAQTVTSVNAVGMVKVTFLRGELKIAQIPFLAQNGNAINVSELFGSSLPNGTKIYVWDNVSQGYIIEQLSRGAWSPGTTEVDRTKAMFVSIPSNAANASYDIVFVGEVPDANSAPNTSISLPAGLTLTAFPYPTAVSISDAQIPAQNGDKVYFWQNGWVIEQYSRGAWSPGTSTFEPGVGFYYSSTALKNWLTDKPYNWP